MLPPCGIVDLLTLCHVDGAESHAGVAPGVLDLRGSGVGDQRPLLPPGYRHCAALERPEGTQQRGGGHVEVHYR